MRLEEALTEVHWGRSYLFVGAGFSVGATNLLGNSIPLATELAATLLAECGITDIRGFDLSLASEEYEQRVGRQRLVELLMRTFSVKNVSEHHVSICKYPWSRIYTTNYDNVVESAYQKAAKPLNVVTLADPANKPSVSISQCVHLNGFIQRIDQANYKDILLLSHSSYNQDIFNNSLWKRTIQTDIRYADSVIVVGYSMSDLDLSRLFYASNENKGKTHFVVEEDAPPGLVRKLSLFGAVHQIGVKRLAAMMNSIDKPLPAKSRTRLPRNLTKVIGSREPFKVRDDHVFDLLLKGHFDYRASSQEQILQTNKYYVHRKTAEALRRFGATEGPRIALLHSDIGNGKTLLMNALAVEYALQGRTTYLLTYTPVDHERLIDFIESCEEKTIVFFENPLVDADFLRRLLNISNSLVYFVLSMRTVQYEIRYQEVFALLDKGRYIEFDINRLSSSEIDLFAQYLSDYAFWGAKQSLSGAQKHEYLARDCRSEVRSILLAVLDSPAIRQRLDKLFGYIEKLPAVLYDAIILTSFLRKINFTSADLSFVSDLIGQDIYLSVAERKNEDFLELFRDGDDIEFKSPVIGTHFLANRVDDEYLLDCLVQAIVAADRLRESDSTDLFYGFLRVALRYSSVVDIFGPQKQKTCVLRFFEETKTLRIANYDPLFWVQYSIARMSFGDYGPSAQYIEAAYSLAKKRPKFDPYQIETHHARFLLESRLDGFGADYFAAMKKVHGLLMGVLKRRSEEIYHPFEIAKRYYDYLEKFGSNFTEGEKLIAVRYLSEMKSRIEKVPTHIQARYRVISEARQCISRAVRFISNRDSLE